jgi:hypothetical protein
MHHQQQRRRGDGCLMFNADAFVATPLALRTEEVPVPDLAAWFDSPAVWRVRGLDANELAKVDQAERRNEAADALAEALSSGTAAQITEGVREVLGRTGGIESVYARQIEILVLGSVEPVITHAIAAKLGETFPVVFKILVNAILSLTGQGADAPKKPAASTATPA